MPSNKSPQVYSLLPRQVYEEMRGWNASLLKVVLNKTPSHAYHAFLSPNKPPNKDSAAFRIGTLVHQTLLEPEVFSRIVPCSSGPTTKAYAQAVADAQASGNTIAQESEYGLAKAMGDAVLAHPTLGQLFAPTEENIKLNEFTLSWPDPLNGQPCRARLDAVRITDDELLILDLKTCNDASFIEFGKSAASFGYLVQSSFYTDGLFYACRALEAHLGLKEGALIGKSLAFEFVCIEKEYPHHIARYRMTDEQAVLGRKMYRKALDLVTSASELDYWPGYDPGPQALVMPGWAFTQAENLL